MAERYFRRWARGEGQERLIERDPAAGDARMIASRSNDFATGLGRGAAGGALLAETTIDGVQQDVLRIAGVLPEHDAAEVMLPDVLCPGEFGLGVVVGDEGVGGRVVQVRGLTGVIPEGGYSHGR